MDRFFGRLALDGAIPDDETLRAIRDNADGLQSTIPIRLVDLQFHSSIFVLDIAGERLWIELKRTAEGRNAGVVLKAMLEQNVGQYLGKLMTLKQARTQWDHLKRNSI